MEIYTASTSNENLSGNFDVVALGADTIYLAAYEGSADGKGNLALFVSTNGGSSWTKRTVVEGTPQGKGGENNPYRPVISLPVHKKFMIQWTEPGY